MKINPEQVNGVMLQYYEICHKKLWYFVHSIQMEQNSETVSIGRELHDTSYQRTKIQEVELDGIVKFDRVEGEYICEIKKSKAVKQSHISQMKFYLWYLKQKGIDKFKGKLLYPLNKQTEIIELTSEDEEYISDAIQNICLIVNQKYPPRVKKMKICKSCSYEELCWC